MIDASIKSIIIGAVWILTDINWSFEIKHYVYNKNSEYNTPIIAEAYIILDFITIIE